LASAPRGASTLSRLRAIIAASRPDDRLRWNYLAALHLCIDRAGPRNSSQVAGVRDADV
jgi:hypothetical protein